MWKKLESNMLWLWIGAGFLLLPVADTRPIGALPLYPLDYVSFFLLSLTTFVLWKKSLYKEMLSYTGALVGIFFLSSVLSWLVNGATLTGLGQLKSWFFLPALAALFTALALRNEKERDKNLLKVWFVGLLSLVAITLVYSAFGFVTFDGRLQGPFTSPNFLAFFLSPGLLLSYYFYEQAVEQKYRIVLGMAGLIFASVLFMTHSFGGLLAMFGMITWYFFQKEKFSRHIKKIALIGFLAGIFLVGELLAGDKLAGILEERSSFASRLTIWEVSLKAVQDNPLFGIGIGRFQEVYLSYQSLFPPYLEWAVPEPHNILLALWLQAGAAGLIALLWLVYQAFQKGTKTAKEHQILRALLVGMLLYGIFDTPLFGNALAWTWWAVLAFLLFPLRGKKKSPESIKGLP